MSYTSIVVGTDGSQTATEAVRQAARLAAACGARLTIVTAFEAHPSAVARAQEQAPEEIRWRITDSAAAEEKLAQAQEVATAEGAADVHCSAEHGEAADVVISLAERTGADLIVVGSKGMTSASRFLLGSVPNKVSHHAPCDVLIVHTTD